MNGQPGVHAPNVGYAPAVVAVAVDGISSLGHSGIVTLNGLNGLSGISGVSGVVGSLAYAAFHASWYCSGRRRGAMGEQARGRWAGGREASRGVPS